MKPDIKILGFANCYVNGWLCIMHNYKGFFFVVNCLQTFRLKMQMVGPVHRSCHLLAFDELGNRVLILNVCMFSVVNIKFTQLFMHLTIY